MQLAAMTPSYSALLLATWLSFFSVAAVALTPTAAVNDTRIGAGSGQRLKQLLLKRHTRFVNFPKKANFVLTTALTKIIIGYVPAGLQTSFEFDIYYPVPDTVEAWRPNVIFDLLATPPPPNTTAAPVPDVTPPPAEIAVNMTRKMDTSFTYDDYAPAPWPAYDSGPVYDPAYDGIRRQLLSDHQRDFFSKSQRPLKPASRQKPPARVFYQSPLRFSDNGQEQPSSSSYTYKPAAGGIEVEPEVYERWSDVPSWKFNRGYRERRALYDQLGDIGKIFNFDMTACIKSAMCEMSAQLMQQGKSGLLIDDLMDILLTVPLGIVDEKYEAQHAGPRTSEYCARSYSVSCPFRVLDFFNQGLPRFPNSRA